MSKVLLTGATGFLGSHLLKGLLEKTDFEIVVLKRSSSNCSRIEENQSSRIRFYNIDQTNLGKIFEENKLESIIHCATNYGRDDENIVNIVQSNLVLPLELLQLCAVHEVKNFINTDTVIDKKISHYSLSKSHFKDWLREFSVKIKCININLEHFYGPFDNDTKFTSNIIRSLIKKVEKLDLTDGLQRRSFIYIDDVVDAFITILSNINNIKDLFNNFDVGAIKNISIQDFVLLTKKLTNNIETKLNFGALPHRPNEIMEIKIDTSSLQALGWFPKIMIEEGLKLTINKELNQ